MGLGCARGVPLRALVGRQDQVLVLELDLLQGCDFAVELAAVGAEEGVAFPDLGWLALVFLQRRLNRHVPGPGGLA